MDDATQKAWDFWLWSHLNPLADVIGGELGGVMRKQNDALIVRLNALENIVEALEARIGALEAEDQGYLG
jgi:hypothetical protein